VGAGFHPELTGRENIYLYSGILGRSAGDTRERFDDIVSFAELSDFVDAPLRVYSAGMSARLGIAVAVAQTPDILLVDEVLGAGDEQFRLKCQKKFQEFRDAGATVVIVTHTMSIAKAMCDRAAWLMNGKLMGCGDSASIVEEYEDQQRRAQEEKTIRRG
jgi:ABC-2 type transport system ATP-binding protein